jgi:nucleoside-diphosphate-sugar epimerase
MVMVEENKKSQLVLVDGATGYVGNHLAHELKQNGMRVRCLVRTSAKLEDIQFLKELGAEIVVADLIYKNLSSKNLGDKNLARQAFADVDTAVHLIGTIAPKRGESLEQLHAGETEAFASYCKEMAVGKAVMLTALGTSPNAVSLYHRTKWQAEEKLREAKVNAIFVRPSLLIGKVVGRRDSKLVSRFQEMILTRKKVPVIGDGSNKVQPLFIQDLVKAMRIAIETNPGGIGSLAPVYELAGGRVVSMREFLTELMKAIDVVKPVANVPIPLAKLAAGLAETFQEVPVLSRDQVLLSMTDNVCITNHLTTVFNIEPTDIVKALQTYKSEIRNESVKAGKSI